MPVFVTRELEIKSLNSIAYAKALRDFKLIADTEFTQRDKMIVDGIGIYLPGLIDSGLLVFEYEELTPEFHPVKSCLEALGHSVQVADDESLGELLTNLAERFTEIVDLSQSPRLIKKDYLLALENGDFDDLLLEYGLDRSNLSYYRDSKAKESYPIIQPVKIRNEHEFFFAPADLFKIWGQEWKNILLSSDLMQFRSLRVGKPISQYFYIDEKLHELEITIRDSMYRFPPRKKSLDGQAKTFGLAKGKIDIVKKEFTSEMNIPDENLIKKNMSLFKKHFREIFFKYNAQDIFTSHELSETQQEFFNIILDSFNIPSIPVADTTGANVAKFIKETIFQHYNVSEDDKASKNLLKRAIQLTRIQNLQETPLNDFGIQPFLTVGGLLYTRMNRIPFIEGTFGDLDLQSCYATAMSNMSIYLGQPMVLTFKHKKYKPTLKEAIECIELHNTPDDAWFVRVSGELKQAINTLVLSDLRFKPQSIKMPTQSDIIRSRKSIEQFNAFKTSKPQAVSTILTKEIKFGLINRDILECLKLLPNDWYEEYLNLQCDVIVYIPGDLIADNLEDYQTIIETLPDEDSLERFNAKEGTKGADGQRYKNNAVLKFPISEFWQQLKTKRGEFKKAKNPVQEVYKLFQNSGYGVMACLHLSTNNMIASNVITAFARANAWLMTNFLNGFAPITDGTSFSWKHICTNKTFKDVLTNNRQYLTHFDESIQSDLTESNFNQKWIDTELKKNIAKFYEINENHYLIQRFNYELKAEEYITIDGKKIETTTFTRYGNTNAGNYFKGIAGSGILIEDNEYDFERQENYIKARSFQGDDTELLNWYVNSITKEYKQPLIYSENKVIKFGDGNQLAIRFLQEGIEKIAHPMGFSTTGYKMMKLISRSQFLFQSEKQLRNFETNETKLSELSKQSELNLRTKTFWNNLDQNQLNPYNVIRRDGVEYYEYAKNHPVGVGFELLALSKKAKGSIKYVRTMIDDYMLKGCIDFNAGLHLNRNFKLGENFQYLLAAVIILKKNAEDDLKQCLINSANEPTLLTVTLDNIVTLEKLLQRSDGED